MNTAEVVYKIIANKAKDLSDKVSLDGVIKMADVSRNFYQVLQFLEQNNSNKQWNKRYYKSN